MSVGGPLERDDLARRLSEVESRLGAQEGRKLPEPRARRFLLAVTFDGLAVAGYTKGRLVMPPWANAYSITTYAVTAGTVGSTSTEIAIDVDGSDVTIDTDGSTVITVPASTALIDDGEAAIAIGPGQGPEPYVKTAGTGIADIVLVLGCQTSVTV